MTDEQLDRLMKKLDEIERELRRPDSTYKFVPPQTAPAYPWDGLPAHWGQPRITD